MADCDAATPLLFFSPQPVLPAHPLHGGSVGNGVGAINSRARRRSLHTHASSSKSVHASVCVREHHFIKLPASPVMPETGAKRLDRHQSQHLSF